MERLYAKLGLKVNETKSAVAVGSAPLPRASVKDWRCPVVRGHLGRAVGNRKHWTIENRCHYVIDWNFDEDRSRIRTGFGPENVTRLRRFAVGVLTLFSDGKTSLTQKMAKLNRNTRLLFDYLRMTKNSTRQASH